MAQHGLSSNQLAVAGCSTQKILKIVLFSDNNKHIGVLNYSGTQIHLLLSENKMIFRICWYRLGLWGPLR